MRPSETLAVLGAAGGVGLAAVELGRVMGARVIACASTDDKLDFARAHGAHEGVNYDNGGSARRAQATRRRAWHRRGVRSGRRPPTASRRYARWPGKAGISWSASLPAKFRNCRSISCCSRVAPCWAYSGGHGSGTTRSVTRPPSTSRAVVREGKLSCHIQQVYSLAETPTALKALADRKVMGKLVVRP